MSTTVLRGHNHKTNTRCYTCPCGKWDSDQEIRRENNQVAASRYQHWCSFPSCRCHRPMIAIRDLTAMDCDVEFSETGAHNPTAGRRWKLEPERGQFHLTVDSFHDVSKNSQHNESSPLEVSLTPEAASHARLPDEQDRKKHEPDLLIEIRAPQVKRGPRDPTDDEVIQHALVTCHSRLVSHVRRCTWDGRHLSVEANQRM